MVLGRFCVSGVLVVGLETAAFEPSHIALLAPLVDEARALGARGIVLDFGPGTHLAPAAALALDALAASLAGPAPSERGSGVYRLDLEPPASLAIAGLSAASRAPLEAEPSLADVVLAEGWTDAVSRLTARFATVVPPRRSAAPRAVGTG